MIRRLIVLALLAGAAFLIYSNRHRLAVLTGLENNRIRIQGDWYEVQSGFKGDDRYAFFEEMVSRNDESVGTYYFTSHNMLVVTIHNRRQRYSIEFPDGDTMDWYQTVKGERTLRRRWKR